MSRLIDADGLKGCVIIRPTTQEHMELLRPLYVAAVAHDDIPTAYDVDKVVEKLKEVGNLEIVAHSGRCNGKTLTLGYRKGIENAIEIVKGGGKSD